MANVFIRREQLKQAPMAGLDDNISICCGTYIMLCRCQNIEAEPLKDSLTLPAPCMLQVIQGCRSSDGTQLTLKNKGCSAHASVLRHELKTWHQ